MIVCFNNCHTRNYDLLYGSGAFYDLKTIGFQATKATNLSIGQRCIVATPSTDGQIVFSWFSFLHETVLPDDTSTPNRVFFGKPIKSESFSKENAARDGVYSTFFDKNGHFKRQSVIQMVKDA